MARQKIIDAAIAVLNEDLSAPLDRIAAHAGLSRRTLHRYFSDRNDLLGACMSDMMQTWQSAMMAACSQDTDSLRQLELMLYAGIDCGSKYAFLNKLGELPETEHPDKAQQAAYEQARDKWFSLIPELQQAGRISNRLTAAWIRELFTGMIATTIRALQSGSVAAKEIKTLAWYSFRRSIGID